MITYQITSTTYSLNPDGTAGRITSVIWNALKTEEAVTGALVKRGTPIADDYAPADVPYSDVTEADLVAWVTELEDQVSIEEQLDVAIAEITAPEEGTGIPWQDSFPTWVVGIPVEVGDVYTYQDVGYEVVQAHTTSAEWPPSQSRALWKLYVPPSEGPQPWVQPIGSEDAYPIGSQVTYTGNLWTSLVDANVWEPTASEPTLWQDEGAYP